MDYDYPSSYYSTPSYTTAASSPLDPLMWVMVIIMVIIMLILSLAVMAVVLASLWRMFQGWQARLGCPYPYLQYRRPDADHRSAWVVGVAAVCALRQYLHCCCVDTRAC